MAVFRHLDVERSELSRSLSIYAAQGVRIFSPLKMKKRSTYTAWTRCISAADYSFEINKVFPLLPYLIVHVEAKKRLIFVKSLLSPRKE